MIETNVKKLFKECGAEAAYTTCEYMKQYLTGGYVTEGGFVLTDENGSTLYTDSRYAEEANKFFAWSDIKVELMTTENTPSKLLKKYKTVAIPFAQTTVPEYEALKKIGCSLVDDSAAFTKVMSVKNDYELKSIARACEIAEDGFNNLLPDIKEGMTETEVAALLEYNMRKLGAYSTSFDTIVGFGANASIPHHVTDDTVLKFGDEILIDFGCKVNGYCSDITRTFLFGDDGKHQKFKELYNHVLAAHLLVQEKGYSGMTGKEADAIARNYLAAHGLDKYFTHSLGHGIGINIHEFPRLSARSEDLLVEGMVFSDEPGVYFEGELGIRIEDSTHMYGGRITSFMHKTDKNLIIL